MISSVSSESLHYCTQINHHWLWALKPHASVLLHSWAITVSRPFPITTRLQFLARVIVIVHDKLHRLHPIVHKASESVWFNLCSETECDRTNIQPKMHFWFKSWGRHVRDSPSFMLASSDQQEIQGTWKTHPPLCRTRAYKTMDKLTVNHVNLLTQTVGYVPTHFLD